MEFSKDSYNLHVFLTFILSKKILFDCNRITPFPPFSLLTSAPSICPHTSSNCPSYLLDNLFVFFIIVTHIQMYTCICMYTHTNIHTDTHGHTHSHIQPAESSFVACEYRTSKLTIPHYITNKGAHTRGRLIFLSSEVISCL